MDNLTCVKYNDSIHKDIWEQFVKTGVLGTIYHTRKFMSYHPHDRFEDNSLLLYANGELVCVVPACRKKEVGFTGCTIFHSDGDISIDPEELSTPYRGNYNPYFSYMGSTYGGPVFLKKYFQTKYVMVMIDHIFQYYNNNIEFRMANDIYYDDNVFMVYSILATKRTMIPEMSWYIRTGDNFIDNMLDKRNRSYLKKTITNKDIKCYKTHSEDVYKQFYTILHNNLKKNHDTTPTHTLEEFMDIKNILENNAALYVVENIQTNQLYGGVYVIKVTNNCWYTFYISRNVDIEDTCARVSVPYLMCTISNDAAKEGVKYLDYGICTEDRGKLVNIGLAEFKEKVLGGHASARYLFVS